VSRQFSVWFFWLLAPVLLAGFRPNFGQAQTPAAEDEQTLHAAGLGGGPALLAFFHARARTTADGETLDRLLQQLAAAAREEQESAAAKLLGLGPLALPALRQAANDLDRPAVAARAARCLPWLDGPGSIQLVMAATRTLAVRRPEGAAAALLAYLPFADNAEIVQVIQGALAAVAAPGGKADAALLRGLGDRAGLRRAAAGVALCRASPPQSVPAVRNLLKDPAPAVRLRTALALAEAGDAEAVPVLIDLLAELSAEQRRPVEEVLKHLAAEWAPVLEFPRDDEVSRGIRRDAWAGWWRRTDDALLLGTLGKHTLTAPKREQARRLIARLGGEAFADRERAGQELAALGRIALPQLREATGDRDAEVVRRAAGLIERIEREPSQQLPLAVLRLLAVRKPAGAVEALLAYLPDAAEEERSEEVRQALGRLALRDGKLDPNLRQALSDARPLARATAARALIESGGANGRAAARKLLGDEAPLVRLHVAQALARAGERAAVPVLIDLLPLMPAEQVWQVEDALYALAGDSAPAASAGEKPQERKKCRDAWAAWWKANGDRIDLALLRHPPLLGLTLLCDSSGKRVVEIDRHGKELWAIEKVGDPVDAVVLPGQRVLIAEWDSNRVTERDFQGKVLWEKKLEGHPCNVQRLANGNTWVAVQNGPILEVDRAGKEVWTIPSVPAGVQAAQRSRRGDIVCLAQNGQCLLLDASGKQRGIFATGHEDIAIGALDLLANGHVLIACYKTGKVLEFDRDGKKVLEWEAPGMSTASALPNGHILGASLEQRYVREMDRAGKTVWEYRTTGNLRRARRR
jgi:HEAT repeat protein/outer membrane protein assembly factor BamB